MWSSPPIPSLPSLCPGLHCWDTGNHTPTEVNDLTSSSRGIPLLPARTLRFPDVSHRLAFKLCPSYPHPGPWEWLCFLNFSISWLCGTCSLLSPPLPFIYGLTPTFLVVGYPFHKHGNFPMGLAKSSFRFFGTAYRKPTRTFWPTQYWNPPGFCTGLIKSQYFSDARCTFEFLDHKVQATGLLVLQVRLARKFLFPPGK